MKLRKIPGSHPKSYSGIVVEIEGQQSKIVTAVTIMHCLRFDVHKKKELIGDLNLEIINEIRKSFGKRPVDLEGNLV